MPKNTEKDKANIIRTAFIRDIDKIIHCPFYNRYADKTQVFSFYKNDDITRRGLHVQLVSRIARTIGSALNLNLDLIEAIALGHDIGHTPFGHAGEKLIGDIYHERTGRFFNHNVRAPVHIMVRRDKANRVHSIRFYRNGRSAIPHCIILRSFVRNAFHIIVGRDGFRSLQGRIVKVSADSPRSESKCTDAVTPTCFLFFGQRIRARFTQLTNILR